ncbi:serine hydrolase [Candidatus Kaiserbacteria bacterium]|nr:serine hydrolase [Candidatus Kaiserbacteria bacterium]
MSIKFLRKHIVASMIVGSVAFFVAGTLSGTYIAWYRVNTCGDAYSFINAEVICGKPDVIKKTGYIETREKVAKFIEGERNKGRLSEASVYFRDLKHGPVFGINEFAEFAPASLLKLPLSLVFLNSAEDQPEVLSAKIQYVGTSTVSDQRVKPSRSAAPNHAYSIDELLELMLVYSDNASYEALESFLAAAPHRMQLREEVFQELGLIDPKDRIESAVNVRGYASIFRILYNVSYLNADLSEKALAWLSRSEYKEGIVAGVPSGVAVAHKFGERLLDDDTKQLHDCGVVYYADNPYLLCVMTRGNDWNELAHVISTISGMVYREVDSRRL